jgi:hypothetical protein
MQKYFRSSSRIGWLNNEQTDVYPDDEGRVIAQNVILLTIQASVVAARLKIFY